MRVQVRQYILSVIAAAVLCGILYNLCIGKTTASVMKLICGIFLSLVVMSPLRTIDLTDLPAISLGFLEEGRQVTAEGEKMAMDSYSTIIKERTEAYILDKAEALDAGIAVEVFLDGDAIPVGVRISGNVSPFAQSALTACLEEDLGIAKEAQEWIDGN